MKKQLAALAILAALGGHGYAQSINNPSSGVEILITADTDIAAGTGVAINASGHVTQTWGPTLGTPYAMSGGRGNSPQGNYGLLVLDGTHFINRANRSPQGVQACSTDGAVTISCGSQDTSAGSTNMLQSTCGVPQFSRPNAVALDGTHFAYAWKDSGNADDLTVTVGAISNNTISYGSNVDTTFVAQNESVTCLSPIDSTHFLMVFQKNADHKLYAVVVTVSGTTPSLGTPVAVSAAALGSGVWFSNFIDSTHFVVLYNDNATMKARVGTVSGATVSFGTAQSTASNILQDAAGEMFAVLDSTDIAIFSGQSYITVASISGTVITFGTPTLNNNLAHDNSAASFFALDSTHVAWAYGASGGNIYYAGYLQIGTISGLAISFSAQTLLPSPSQYPNMASNFPGLNSPYWGIKVSSGIAIFTDGQWNLYTQGTSYSSAPVAQRDLVPLETQLYRLDDTHVVELAGTTAGNAGVVYTRIIIVGTNIGTPIGFASNPCRATNLCQVEVSGLISGFTGLTMGARYFVNGDGTLTTTNTGQAAGYAINSTTLLIGK